MRHTRIISLSNTKQGRIRYLQRTILTPHIMPKTNLWPIPHLKSNKFRKLFPPLLICFQTPTPNVYVTSLEHQPPNMLSYLVSITNLHNASLSIAYRHSHFPKKAWLNWIKFLTPNPPDFIGVQILAQFTKWNLNSSPIPLHKKIPLKPVGHSHWNRGKRHVICR
jgi:hypothetical protein